MLVELSPANAERVKRLFEIGVLFEEDSCRNTNAGKSNYSTKLLQPWSIWLDNPELTPWDMDIIKRVIRTKETDDRSLDYEKIAHICQERLRQLRVSKQKIGIAIADVAHLSTKKIKAPIEPSSSCPVPNDTPLLIHYRDSVSVKMVRPQMMRWGHLGVSMDIMYYEILEDN